MPISRPFFMFLAGLISIVGLFAAAWADDYMQIFGFGLVGFGVLFAINIINRHYAELDEH